ncbi:MAG: DUF6737 family protein [Synechococcus sp.]
MGDGSDERNASPEAKSTENIEQLSDSVWDYKPWWCQPWSIVLTGVTVVAASWLLLHRFWISGLVAAPVVMWWTIFLILYPRAMAQSGGLADFDRALGSED